MVNKYKLNKIVEYIKASGFEFETFEVEEEFERILAYYGIFTFDLTHDEIILLKAELLPLAEQFEFGEVAYLTSQEDFLISSIQDRPFSLKAEKTERTMAKACAPERDLEIMPLIEL